MTFGIHGLPNIAAKNITINNNSNDFWSSFAGGFTGSIFGNALGGKNFAANTATALGTVGMPQAPICGTPYPMGGMYPMTGNMYPMGSMSQIGGMMNINPTIPVLPGLSGYSGLNTSGATTGATNTSQNSSSGTSTDQNLKNLNTLFPKCIIVSEGDGKYTAKTESGKILQGSYEDVRDGLGKEISENKTNEA